jgi:hypothetical protein
MDGCTPDQPTAGPALPLADRLLLWALRVWVIGLQRRLDVAEPMRAAFVRFGVADAVEPVDGLMSILACGATQTLCVECVCHPRLTDDEQRLLRAAALHQDDRGFEARFLLRAILTAEASRDAGEMLGRIGRIFAASGLRLSRCAADTERFAFDGDAESPPDGIRATLH